MKNSLYKIQRIDCRRKAIIAVAAVILTGMVMSAPGNVYAQQNGSFDWEESIYSDVKSKRIGDVISVIVAESNSATKNTSTRTEKQQQTSMTGTATTGALKGLFPGMGGTLDASNSFDGEGETTSSGEFASRITVRVIDVLPNKDLVIEGTKTMQINDDTEVVTISGVVRPEDVSSANTVYSYEIANAKIAYKGKGAVKTAARAGIISRILDFIL